MIEFASQVGDPRATRSRRDSIGVASHRSAQPPPEPDVKIHIRYCSV